MPQLLWYSLINTSTSLLFGLGQFQHAPLVTGLGALEKCFLNELESAAYLWPEYFILKFLFGWVGGFFTLAQGRAYIFWELTNFLRTLTHWMYSTIFYSFVLILFPHSTSHTQLIVIIISNRNDVSNNKMESAELF